MNYKMIIFLPYEKGDRESTKVMIKEEKYLYFTRHFAISLVILYSCELNKNIFLSLVKAVGSFLL